MARRRVRPDQRQAEQNQTRDRDGDRELLAPRESPDERSEQSDSTGGRCLHDRERRERERGDVEAPAADADEEADHPAEVAEQQGQ